VSVLLFLMLWLPGFLLLWRIPVPQPSTAGQRRQEPTVSVIVPARNEAANLPALLNSLRAQSPPPLEVIVVDDQSSDGTGQVALDRGARVLESAALPEGWLGKPWACWQGARAAAGDVLVFLDADTRLEPDGLARLVDTWGGRGGLLSVQPYHRMGRPYEQLAAFFNVVAMAGLGVFSAWADRVPPLGAFGPCNVCRRADYFATGGHEAARSAVVESLPLGRAFLERGLPVRCQGGRGTVSFRMYPDGWASLIEGFGKGFALGADAIPKAGLVLIVAWLTAGFEALRHLLAAAAAADPLGLYVWAGGYLLFAGQFYWMLARIGNFRPLTALLYPVPQVFFLGVFLKSLLDAFVVKRVNWKGRSLGTS
jgi:4,4'-diaponeurosporenoate glycosyltransferase